MEIRIKPNYGYTSITKDTIKQNIEAYLKSLDIGGDVSIMGLLTTVSGVVVQAKHPEFSLKEIKANRHGTSPGNMDITIAFNEVTAVGAITDVEVS